MLGNQQLPQTQTTRGLDSKIKKVLKKAIFSFLDPKKTEVFIFGSRTTGKTRKFSDFDIGIVSKRRIPGEILVQIEELFEESDFPYTVDLVDFSLVSERFRNIALKRIIRLN